jgi:hypothetical protein
MKKTLRGISATLLACTAALAFTGCGSDSPSGGESFGVPIIRRVDGGNKSLSVRWTDEGAEGYDLYYNETGEDPGQETEAVLTGIEEVVTEISGLADGATYSVWVRVNGGGQWSEGETGTTLRGGKALTEFKIGNAAGVIDEAAKTVTVKVPYAETANQAVTWAVSPGAAVSLKSAENLSGVSVYTVSAENGETQDYTVTKIVEGQGGIVLSFTDEGSAALEGQIAALSKAAGTSVTLEAAVGYESYEWYVDGESKTTNRSITLSAAAYSLGKHYVSVEVWKNGVLYSKEAAFTVVD